jgi:hypothetical protein
MGRRRWIRWPRATGDAHAGAGNRRAARPSTLGLVCGFAVLAVVGAGCGAEERTTEARPQPPTRVSVTVSEDRVTVQPRRIAFGPEPNQQIPQNAHAGQPPVRSRAPLDVTLVAANLTPIESHLELRGRGKRATSQRLVAGGNVTLQTSLPTGVYRLAAAGIPAAKPARLVVGPYRSSSQNDVLLP